jgi:O-methyltransferase
MGTMNWKVMVQRLFRKLGYRVSRIDDRSEYTLSYPYDYFTYAPWFASSFKEKYARFKDHTLLEEHRCYIIHQLSQHSLHLEGDFAECGVYKGGSALLMADTLTNASVTDKQLWLFDTFAGMPAMADEDPSKAVKHGTFGDTSLDGVREYLKEFPFAVFNPGLIPDTLYSARDRSFAFVHVDVDLYKTHLECCEFFYPRMVKGGIMLFDDYGHYLFKASARSAVDEFFHDKPEPPIALHTGQCFVIKL